jgi:hypothetical protein
MAPTASIFFRAGATFLMTLLALGMEGIRLFYDF